MTQMVATVLLPGLIQGLGTTAETQEQLLGWNFLTQHSKISNLNLICASKGNPYWCKTWCKFTKTHFSVHSGWLTSLQQFVFKGDEASAIPIYGTASISYWEKYMSLCLKNNLCRPRIKYDRATHNIWATTRTFWTSWYTWCFLLNVFLLMQADSTWEEQDFPQIFHMKFFQRHLSRYMFYYWSICRSLHFLNKQPPMPVWQR